MRGSSIKSVVVIFLLSIVTGIFIFPIYWLVMTSLKNPKDIWVSPLKWVFTPTLMNYLDVSKSVLRPFINSVTVTGTTILIAFCIGLPCAYALARFPIKRKENIAMNFLAQFMLPPMVLIVGFYIFFNELRLVGSRIALIMAYLAFDLPLVVWLMKDYFEGIPKEIDEAAMVDGCSHLGSFFRISLPLAKPGLMVAGIMCFIFTWNEYFFAVILTSRTTQTLPLLLGMYYRQYDVAWGSIAALGVVTIAPVVVFGILIQRRLVRGLTLGALKE
jgi:multiple sugar transport system permease protein